MKHWPTVGAPAPAQVSLLEAESASFLKVCLAGEASEVPVLGENGALEWLCNAFQGATSGGAIPLAICASGCLERLSLSSRAAH